MISSRPLHCCDSLRRLHTGAMPVLGPLVHRLTLRGHLLHASVTRATDRCPSIICLFICSRVAACCAQPALIEWEQEGEHSLIERHHLGGDSDELYSNHHQRAVICRLSLVALIRSSVQCNALGLYADCTLPLSGTMKSFSS